MVQYQISNTKIMDKAISHQRLPMINIRIATFLFSTVLCPMFGGNNKCGLNNLAK